MKDYSEIAIQIAEAQDDESANKLIHEMFDEFLNTEEGEKVYCIFIQMLGLLPAYQIAGATEDEFISDFSSALERAKSEMEWKVELKARLASTIKNMFR